MSLPQMIEILLVEDNPNDVELILRALQRNNSAAKLHVVRDGAEALDFLGSSGTYASRRGQPLPKVILLDLKLPKMTGLEVLQRVKSNPATAMVPVVVLSSSQQDRDIAQCYKLGANSYIVKPVDFDKFVQAITELGLYWLLLNQPPIPNA